MEKIFANNKKAYFDYFIEEKLEAGIVLTGTEIKSVRKGACSLKEAYISISSGEVFIHGMHISPYDFGNIFNTEPLRERKLLLHKKEIRMLKDAVAQKGYTIVPLNVHLTGSHAKLEIAVAKGKKNYDKRHSMAEKDARREIERSRKRIS